ncbi:XRE family transcriptional regulator [Cupriavidus respiraculi]
MIRPSYTLEPWQVEDAQRLKGLFAARKGKMSQEEFGNRYSLGSQSMVWQYLNAKRPLNIRAATAFARGLGVDVDDFSPRLAAEIRRASAEVVDTVPTAKTAEGTTPAGRLAQVMAEQNLDVERMAEVLKVEPAVVRGWLEGEGTKLPVHHAIKLHEIYGYSPPWLVNGKGDRLAKGVEADLDEPSLSLDTIRIPAEAFKRIPVRGMAQLGDNGHFCEIEYPVGDGDGFLYFPTRDPDAYGLRCNGDSMRPRVKHGEFVVVEPNTPVTNGDEVLVKSQDGRVMVKELAYIRDGSLHLASVNEKHGMLRIPQAEVERLHFVAGIVKRSAWRPD